MKCDLGVARRVGCHVDLAIAHINGGRNIEGTRVEISSAQTLIRTAFKLC